MDFRVISADDLDSYVGSNAVIIDLRSGSQYSQGHISGAVNIPFDQLDNSIGRLPKNRTLVFYCQHGSQSLMACRQLAGMGFSTVSVNGGLGFYRGNKLTRC